MRIKRPRLMFKCKIIYVNIKTVNLHLDMKHSLMGISNNNLGSLYYTVANNLMQVFNRKMIEDDYILFESL